MCKQSTRTVHKIQKDLSFIKFRWRASHKRMIGEMLDGFYVVADGHRASDCKFIPLGKRALRVLIHLLSRFFLWIMSSVHRLSITHTNRSDSEWPSLLSGRPLVTPQSYHGWRHNGGYSFFYGAVVRNHPHTGDHTSYILLSKRYCLFCMKRVLWW